MPNRRKTVNQIKETLRLKECELSVRQISKAVNISRPKVSEYLSKFEQLNLNYESVKDIPDSELSELLYAKKKDTKKHEKLYDYFPEYLKRLKQKGMTLEFLWEEYKGKHLDGLFYSRFCYHFHKWRKLAKLDMHIEHKAGDKIFVDFTGDKLSYYDKALNKYKEVEVFVAILGASQLTYVEAVESQKKHDWIKVNDNTLHYFGGVPQAIVPDCLKSGVTKANKYEPDINPEYADFARHYNTTILPARPYRAKDKALVENAVKIMYTRIFVPIRKQTFYSLEELNEAIKYYLEKHNNKNFQRINISRWGLFNETEKEVLMPLPAERYKIKKFSRPKVLGVMLLNLENPKIVIARAHDYIMEPETKFEKNGISDNVVFPCGNVVIGDELFVYYGGADSVCCLATTKVKDLLDFVLQYKDIQL